MIDPAPHPVPWLTSGLVRLLRWFPATWRALDDDSARARQAGAAHAGGRYDTQVAQILCVVAVVLTCQWYWGDRPYFHELFGKRLQNHHRWGRYYDLLAFCWWSGSKVLGFWVVPVLHIRLLGKRVRDFGLLRQQALASSAAVGGWVYLLLFGAVLPLVVLVSFTKVFQETYPFYRLAGRSWLDFLGWELQYGATFFTLEFFFRGYMLFGLRRYLGSYAIFVMMVPYCMIHVLKPASESLGAIIAGVVLGTLALGTGSIWYGVLIHLSVAWSMDLLASLQTHSLPRWGHLLP